MPPSRRANSSATTLRVKYKAGTVGELVRLAASDVSVRGMFVRTPKTLPVGTAVRLELLLDTEQVALSVAGQVLFTRSAAGRAPLGMGVEFGPLGDAQQQWVAQAVAARGAGVSQFDNRQKLDAPLPSGTAAPLPSGTEQGTAAPLPSGTVQGAFSSAGAQLPAPSAVRRQSPPAPADPIEGGERDRPLGAARAPRTSSASLPGLFSTPALAESSPPASPAVSSFFPPPPPVAGVGRPSAKAPPSSSARSAFGGMADSGAGGEPAPTVPQQPLRVPPSKSVDRPVPAPPAAPSGHAQQGVQGSPAQAHRSFAPPSGMDSDAPVPSALRSSPPVSMAPPSAATPPTRERAVSIGHGDADVATRAPRGARGYGAVPARDRETTIREAAEMLASTLSGPEVTPSTADAARKARDAADSGAHGLSELFDDIFDEVDAEPAGPPAQPAAGEGPAVQTGAGAATRGEEAPAPGTWGADTADLADEGGFADPLEASFAGVMPADPAELLAVAGGRSGDAPGTAQSDASGPARAPAVSDPEATPTRPDRTGLSFDEPPEEELSAFSRSLGEEFSLDGVEADVLSRSSEPPAMAPLGEQDAASLRARAVAEAMVVPPRKGGRYALVAGLALLAFAVAFAAMSGVLPAPVQTAIDDFTGAGVQQAQQPTGPMRVVVSISTDPRGAQLSVGGEALGDAPVRATLVAGVPVQVTAQYPGYEPLTRQVTPDPAQPQLHLPLVPRAFFLKVVTTPRGAEVEAAGQRCTSPCELPLGFVDGVVPVSVRKAGYRRSGRPVRPDQFVDNQGRLEAEISVELSRLPARR